MKALTQYLTELGWSLEKITKFFSDMEDNHLTEVEALYRFSELSTEDILKLMLEVYDVSYVDLRDALFLSSTTKAFGVERCVENNVIFCSIEDIDYAILKDPSNNRLIESIQNFSITHFAVTDLAVLNAYIESHEKPLLVSQLSGDLNITSIKKNDIIELTDFTENTIQSLIKNLLTMAYKAGASDIQIIPTHEHAEVYFRIDGKRIPTTSISLDAIPPLFRILGDSANQQTTDLQKVVQGKLTYTIEGNPLEVRLNTIPTRLGSSINLRLHLQSDLSIDNLTTSENIKSVLGTIAQLSEGLILFCGPTGSGKSTSMMALAKELMKRDLNICDVEDPVELIVPGINQVDVNEPKNLNYSTITKSFLRHDPDVVIVGEIRDLEVANVAIRASDTGHLVLSTLHTKDAVSAINRLIDLGVNRATLAENITVVIAQRLVRKLCPKCKIANQLGRTDIKRKQFGIDPSEPFEFFAASGCEECNHTGYSGRIVLCECLINTSSIQHAIETGVSSQELASLLEAQGYQPLLMDGVSKVREGLTSFEELNSLLTNSLIKKGELSYASR